MKSIRTAILLLLLYGSPCLAQQLECLYQPTPCEGYANADAVFIAKVTNISPQTTQIWQRDKDYDQTAHLRIEHTYKGPKRTRLVLHQLGRNDAPTDGFAVKVCGHAFSVQPLCSLCLCGHYSLEKTTTETQRTQRLHREEAEKWLRGKDDANRQSEATALRVLTQ